MTTSDNVIRMSTTKDHPLVGATLALGAKPSHHRERWSKVNLDTTFARTKTKAPSYQLGDQYKLPPIYDQGPLGSCVANSAAYLLHYAIINSRPGMIKPKWTQVSRLSLYYYSRYLLGIENRSLYESLMTDTGAYMDDPWEVATRFGMWPETSWPYYVGTFFSPPDMSRTTPWTTVRAAAIPCQPGTDVPSLNGMKLQLSINHNPFSIGIQVYSSFLSSSASRTGDIPLPDVQQEPLLGGHAISIIGYNDTVRRFTFANSWGVNWGNSGYGTIPYDYLTNSTLTFGGDGEPDAYAITSL